MKKFLAIFCFTVWIIVCVLAIVLAIMGSKINPLMALWPSIICVMYYGQILWDMCHETK